MEMAIALAVKSFAAAKAGAAAVASAGGLGASSASAGAASTAAAAGKGITALKVLDGGITAFSAYASYAQGQAQQAKAEEQAFIAETTARGDIIRGRQEGNDILDAANSRIARTITAFGNAGVDFNRGTPSRVVGNLASQVEQDVSQVEENAVLSARVRRSNARSLRSQGRRAGLLGIVQAGVAVGQGAIRIRERG